MREGDRPKGVKGKVYANRLSPTVAYKDDPAFDMFPIEELVVQYFL